MRAVLLGRGVILRFKCLEISFTQSHARNDMTGFFHILLIIREARLIFLRAMLLIIHIESMLLLKMNSKVVLKFEPLVAAWLCADVRPEIELKEITFINQKLKTYMTFKMRC